ncbi:MAG TPA: hypothetical protein ENI11_03165 [Actinobacteria bacterium]|nr:hypothetical protein [Actinomycetota bacterium]
MTHISKRPGDDKVLQVLLEKKIEYIKGSDRAHVADTLSKLGFVDQFVAIFFVASCSVLFFDASGKFLRYYTCNEKDNYQEYRDDDGPE